MDAPISDEQFAADFAAELSGALSGSPVSPAASGAPAAPPAAPAATPAPSASGTAPAGQGPAPTNTVPQPRFNEVVGERNTLREQIQSLQPVMDALQQQGYTADQAAQILLSGQAPAPAPAPQPEAEPEWVQRLFSPPAPAAPASPVPAAPAPAPAIQPAPAPAAAPQTVEQRFEAWLGELGVNPADVPDDITWGLLRQNFQLQDTLNRVQEAQQAQIEAAQAAEQTRQLAQLQSEFNATVSEYPIFKDPVLGRSLAAFWGTLPEGVTMQQAAAEYTRRLEIQNRNRLAEQAIAQEQADSARPVMNGGVAPSPAQVPDYTQATDDEAFFKGFENEFRTLVNSRR